MADEGALRVEDDTASGSATAIRPAETEAARALWELWAARVVPELESSSLPSRCASGRASSS
jgi:hypothetical protein